MMVPAWRNLPSSINFDTLTPWLLILDWTSYILSELFIMNFLRSVIFPPCFGLYDSISLKDSNNWLICFLNIVRYCIYLKFLSWLLSLYLSWFNSFIYSRVFAFNWEIFNNIIDIDGNFYFLTIGINNNKRNFNK